MSSTTSRRTSPTADAEKPVIKRSQGACAECRRKRIRCDRTTREGPACTNCLIASVECTTVASQKPLIQRQREYIRILETRVNRLEGYIQALFPGEDVDAVISKPPPFDKDRAHFPARTGPSLHKESTSTEDQNPDGVSPPELLDLCDADDIGHVELVEQLGSLSLTPSVAYRFFGQASPFMAAKQVSTLRSLLTGVPDTGVNPKHYRRPLFWGMSPWEMAFVNTPEPAYVYPEFDLLLDLVALYFEKTNSLIPIIHEPTFMDGVMSGKHYRDPLFGMTVLLVCANGSRYSQDPRVCFAPYAEQPEFSSGWHYFTQVPIHRRTMLYRPTVYDLQYYALAAIYLSGAAMCPVTPNIVGIGLRYATELGAHRKNGQARPSPESESLKRAFWALFCLDAIDCSFYGRPSGISHESIDVDYPVECDDECWVHENPEKAFTQPSDKPCKVSSFVYMIKLCEILGFASRTLYSTKKSKLLSGYLGNDWELRMVAELDSSLNKWKLSLPSHLTWDPHRENLLFFQQSANLHSVFCYIQIQTHRLFLTRQSSMFFASLAMCTNAARSCGHIQEAAVARDIRILPHTTYIAFTAGIITVLCLWGSHCPGYVGDPQKEMENLLRCVGVLKECEKMWHCSGPLRDILSEAGALGLYDPTAETQGFSPPENTTPTPPLPDIFDHSATVQSSEDVTWSNETWDLYRLYLAEMGHREVQSNQIPEAPPEAEPLSHSSSFNNNFTFWSDAPTAYNCLEEWDKYVQNMGHIKW